MNASPYHSKVRVTLKMADSQFAAGGMIMGRMELECKAEKGLGISMIMVELYAIEGTFLTLFCGLQERDACWSESQARGMRLSVIAAWHAKAPSARRIGAS